MKTVVFALLVTVASAVAQWSIPAPPEGAFNIWMEGVGRRIADESLKGIKVSSSRLTFDENGLAHLNVKTKRKTAEGYEDNIRKVLFSGIAFTEGDDWRAEVNYKEGILDGEVIVTLNKQPLYRFSYEKGEKVLPK